MRITTSTSIKCFVLVACCALVVFSGARADDGEVEGGDIQGIESLDNELAMTPTAAAPSGSSISISLEAEDDSGVTNAQLQLESSGLFAGTYSVSVTLKSDGSTVVLGTFTVDNEGEGEIEFGGDEGTPLPANFNPFDIATISVADSNSVVLFTADLTQLSAATAMTRTATVQATAGASDPNAVGTAVLNAVLSGGKAKGSLQLSGHGLPANTQVTVTINGLTANTRKTKTDGTGKVSLNIKPKNKGGTVASGVTLLQVTSIRLEDKFGNVLLTAGF